MVQKPTRSVPADTAVHEALRIMAWPQFTALLGELLRGQGYDVQEAGSRVAEASIHFVLRRGRERSLVQCRHWCAPCVGVNELCMRIGPGAGSAYGPKITRSLPMRPLPPRVWVRYSVMAVRLM